MSIFSWLKKLKNKFYGQKDDKEERLSDLSVDNKPELTEKTGPRAEVPIYPEEKRPVADFTKKLPLLMKKVTESEKKLGKALGEHEKLKTLTYLGFLILLVMFLGLLLGYWQFMYTAGKNEDYRYDSIYNMESDRKLEIVKLNNELENLKTCLKLDGWKQCF